MTVLIVIRATRQNITKVKKRKNISKTAATVSLSQLATISTIDNNLIVTDENSNKNNTNSINIQKNISKPFRLILYPYRLYKQTQLKIEILKVFLPWILNIMLMVWTMKLINRIVSKDPPAKRTLLKAQL
jgi:hypothetical protein